MDAAEYDQVAEIAEKMAARADEVGINGLPIPEQVIVRTWFAVGVISNGGFRHFYEGATDIAAVADAFEALGLMEASHACRKSMTRFPAWVLAAGYEQSREWMAQFDETELDAYFDPLNDILWGLQENNRLAHALALYIREREEEL